MHNPHRTRPQKHGADEVGGMDMLPAKAPKTQGRCNVHPPPLRQSFRGDISR